MSFSFEKKLLASIVGSVFLTCAIVGIIVIPTIMNIKQMNRDTYNLRLGLEQKNHRVASVRSSLQRLNAMRQEIPDFSRHVFTAGEELALITTLENSAGRNSVTQKITSSNVDSPNKQELSLSLTVTGAFYNVLRYIADAENMNYFLIIRRLQISRGGTTIARGDMAVANLDVSLYVAH